MSIALQNPDFTPTTFRRDDREGVLVVTTRTAWDCYETVAVKAGDVLSRHRTNHPDDAERMHARTCAEVHSKRFERVTVYLRGMLGVVKVECRSLEIQRKRYAQHENATEIRYVPKGGRSTRGTVQRDLFAVVLQGWGHKLEPLDPFGPEKPGGTEGVTVSHSRYSACDPRIGSDFRAMLAAYVKRTGAKVLVDQGGAS